MDALAPRRLLGGFYWPGGPLDARGLTHPSYCDVLLKKIRSRSMDHVDLTLQPTNKYKDPPDDIVRLGDIRWTQFDIRQEWGCHRPCHTLWDTVMTLRSTDPPQIFRSRQAPNGIPTMHVACRKVGCMGKVCRDATHCNDLYTTSSRRLFVFKTVFSEEQMIPVRRQAWDTLFPNDNKQIVDGGLKIRIRCCLGRPTQFAPRSRPPARAHVPGFWVSRMKPLATLEHEAPPPPLEEYSGSSLEGR